MRDVEASTHRPERPDGAVQAAWIARARQGDHAAMRAIFDAHADAVASWCLAFARGSAGEAARLVIATWVRALNLLHRGEGPDPDAPAPATDACLEAWLLGVAREVCVESGLRRRSRRLPAERRAAVPLPETGAGEAASPTIAALVSACPDPTLRDCADRFYGPRPQPVEAIAADLDLPVDEVARRVLRFQRWARTRLLAWLARGLGEDPCAT